MKIYKVYKSEVCSENVVKETKLFYWFDNYKEAFGWAKRIEKKYACLTPQEAIQEALNGRRTMRGAFQDKLMAIENEICI